jgi:tetratricopeptide (TPR) repeat protein
VVDPVEAARLLRAARVAAPSGGEDVEWAFSAMPDRPCAQRLKIEQLLRHGDIEWADALIAQGLLQRPTDAGLTLLRARSLFAQGKLDRAQRELRLVLAKRPHHCGALELAGHVALELGDAHRAAYLFRCIDVRRPDDRIKGLRVTALLEVDRPDLARGILERIQTPSVLLWARVLRAEGRLLEATETLHEARRDEADPDYAPITCALIEVLEEAADAKRLHDVLTPLQITHPAALARAGRAWLGMGAFRTAAVRMARLARVPGYRATALIVLMVAAAMINRQTLAARALRRLRRIDEPVDRPSTAEAWCRGLLGRILLDQRSARQAGADPSTGRLEHLVREAARVFDEELASADTLAAAERAVLERHRAVCRTVLGRFGDRDARPLTANPAAARAA